MASWLPAPLIVPEGQSSAYLAALPPAALRIEPRVVDLLDALGVRSVGDLLMLPRSSLPSRFGQHLVLRIQQALGEVYEPLAPCLPTPPPDAGRGLDGPVSDGQALQAIAAELLAEVLARVERDGQAVRRLDCVLYSEYAPPLVLPVLLSRASRNAAHMLELLGPRLEQAAERGAQASAAAMRRARAELDFSPDADVVAGFVGLRLAAAQTQRWRVGQFDLFEPVSGGDVERLGGLVDRLVNRLGGEALLRAELQDDYQPERAYRYVPVVQSGIDHKPADAAATVDRPAQSRPLRLLERPQTIRVTARVPDGPPTWFYYAGREHAVAAAWGPERIETGWWRGPDVRRDYFRVRTAGGETFWLFHNGADGQWYMHGVFA
ncbi:MAG: hypothetical protein HZB38_00380 [Planctomycetes bacterium]|nr:hypothetical protein [Planctomycetota bacterium]